MLQRVSILAYKATWGAIHTSFQNFTDVKEQVQANRGGGVVLRTALCQTVVMKHVWQNLASVLSGLPRRDPHSHWDQKTTQCLSLQTADHDFGESGEWWMCAAISGLYSVVFSSCNAQL